MPSVTSAPRIHAVNNKPGRWRKRSGAEQPRMEGWRGDGGGVGGDRSMADMDRSVKIPVIPIRFK